jgi:flagellin-like hook-associated protein FlgL
MTRVAFDNSYRTATDQLGLAAKRLQTSQEQLGSGRRVTKSSDDPIAAPKILQLSTSLARLDEYDRNLNFAEERLSKLTDQLSRIGDMLNDLKELSVQGSSGTYSAQDRAAMRTTAESTLDLINGYIAAVGEGQLGIDRTTVVSDGTKMPISLTTTDLAALRTLSTDLGNLIRRQPGNAAADPPVAAVDPLSNAAGWNNLLTKVNDELTLTTDTGALVMSVRYGAQYQQVDKIRETRGALRLDTERIVSNLRDADMGSVAIALSRDQSVLQALQASFAKIQGMSLFSFLR